MPGALQPQNFVGYQIFNTQIPNDGPKALSVLVDFTQPQPITIDLTLAAIEGRFPFAQCVFIDNSANANPLVLTAQLTQQRIQVPAGQQGWYALAASRPPIFTVTCVGGSTNTLLVFSSVPIPTSQWQAGTVAGQIYLTKPASLTPLASSQMGLALVTAQSLTVPAGALYAVVIAEGGNVRWRDDGVAPTGASGMLLTQNSVLNYDANLAAIQFIQATGSTSTIDVAYYK